MIPLFGGCPALLGHQWSLGHQIKRTVRIFLVLSWTWGNCITTPLDLQLWPENIPLHLFTWHYWGSANGHASVRSSLQQRYGTVVTTLNQPLLITKGKWKKSRQDTPHQPIMLVPELCHLTGTADLSHLHKRHPFFKVTNITLQPFS